MSMSTKHPSPYSDQELAILAEEYLIQQHSTFSFQGLCAYIAYWGMEDGHLVEHHMDISLRVRALQLIDRILRDGRIRALEGSIYEKVME